ncbi:MAG: hypothetical protein PVJ64_10970 [Gemmatimonadales bacterium]
MRTNAFRALLPVALLSLAACATGSGDVSPSEEVTVTVENNLHPRTTLTVRIITPTGLSQLLGSVPAGGTETLRYRGRIYYDAYQLVAKTQDGQDIPSLPFNIFPGARVSWSLSHNSISVFEGERDEGQL